MAIVMARVYSSFPETAELTARSHVASYSLSVMPRTLIHTLHVMQEVKNKWQCRQSGTAVKTS